MGTIVRAITLTTDFGTHDWFVGTMKGVLLSVAPNTHVIDLTHEIPPGNIRAGAFALAAGYSFFPRGTVHAAVVDPGVGSSRPAIVAKTSRFFFVAPDNGLLSWALAKERNVIVHRIENRKYFLPEISSTFHGRDIFAPVAAHLSQGLQLDKLGPQMRDYVRLDWPQTRRTPQGVGGEVLYMDRFGNGITNISHTHVHSIEKGQLCVFLGRKRVCRIAAFYQAVPQRQPVAVIGSSGFLEICVNGGSAAEALRLRVGAKVSVRR